MTLRGIRFSCGSLRRLIARWGMARTKVLAKADCLGEVVRSFAVNEEINELLIERLDPAAWLSVSSS